MSNFLGGWSKKMTVHLISIAVVLLNKKLDLGLSETEIIGILGGSGLWSVGQGLADFGKSKAKIDASNKAVGN